MPRTFKVISVIKWCGSIRGFITKVGEVRSMDMDYDYRGSIEKGGER